MRRIRDFTTLKEDLRASVDLVNIIGQYVSPLNQRGQNWFGLCPFHEETTPSFNVSPYKESADGRSRGVWSCLGCRESGDLYSFIQRFHNCNFMEAIELVSEMTGFDVSPYYREMTPEEEYKEQCYEVIAQLAQVLNDTLLANPQQLRFYEERRIDLETLKSFKIGYCESLAWLQTFVSPDVLDFIAPLGQGGDDSHRRAIFDGRLLYPQFTPSGQIWGFFARQPEGVKPKYVGPSQKSPLFEGGARLYGLTQARKLLRQTQLPLLVVEGFHDAMVAQQGRVAAVASCGTELSADQVQTLQAYAVTECIVCWDDDEGGRSGMLRLAHRAHEINSINLKFMRVPGEPSEFIAANGVEEFLVRCKDAVCAIEFVVSHYANMDVSTPTAKLDFLNHIRPYLIHYPRRSVNRALGVQSVARILDMNESAVSDFLEETQDSPLANIRGELVILAELALNPQAWITFPDIQASDFSLERHRRAYQLMSDCYQSDAEVNIDLLLMHARNQRLGKEVVETIQQLPNVTRQTQEQLVRDVRDKALRRNAQQLAISASAAITDLKIETGETLGTFIESVTTMISGRRARHIHTSVDATTAAIAEFERKSASEETIWGLDLGPDWSYLMKFINGLRGGRVHVVAAVSGVGKSIVGVANWGHKLSVWEKGPRAAGLIASMEMSTTENINRMVAIDSGVPHTNIEYARFDSEEQFNLVTQAFDRQRDARITWMEQQKTVKEIALQARLLQSRGDLDYIILDYVQLLDLTPYSDRWASHEKYGAASQELHALAESLDVPIVAIAQLNRSAHQEDIPTGEQMGGAYKIYQDCHVCYTLAPRANKGLLGFLDKNRGGASKKACDLGFDNDVKRSTLRVHELALKGVAAQ